MKCQRCPHPEESHDEHGCHGKITAGWSEAEQRFTKERDCECPGYQELAPEPAPTKFGPSDCPHELQPGGEHPLRCVHCNKTITAERR
jgi:hypothetical protein